MTRLQTDSGELTFEHIRGAVPVGWTTVDTAQWRAAAQALAREGATLVSLWGSDRRDLGDGLAIMAAYSRGDRLLCARLLLRASPYEFPSISDEFPAANRMQRALYDLLGARALGDGDERPWLRQGAWPADFFPLRRDADGARSFASEQEHYAFVPVTGDGVHEIPVGPVHAGIIEPGHFRFSVVGEKVLRLEERLGFVHKGIDKRFEGMPLDDAVRLAGRVSGDSTVAYAWAYSMAVESAAGVTVPARAAWLRALLLERERVGNHLGDLGALGNDAALAVGLAHFSRLRERWLRANDEAFGHRLMMDCIIPGGIRIRPRRRRARAATASVQRTRRRGDDVAHDLRRAPRTAGSLPEHRRGHTGTRGATRSAWSRRTRQRPGARCARRCAHRHLTMHSTSRPRRTDVATSRPA